MNLLQPTDAPPVHFDLLPSVSYAVKAEFKPTQGARKQTKDCLRVITWVNSDTPIGGVGQLDDDQFYDRYCSDCKWSSEYVDIDVDTEIFCSEADCDVNLCGEVEVRSPCDVAHCGVADVCFPCIAGHDRDEGNQEDVELSATTLKFTAAYSKQGFMHADFVSQERAGINSDGNVATTSAYECINAFGDETICWGDNEVPTTLDGIVQTFLLSPANEDLISFDKHEDENCECKSEDLDYEEPEIIMLRTSPRKRAVVCATPRFFPSSFALMCAAGIPIHSGVTTVIAELYNNVAVTEDTVLESVYVSDPTPVGTRLLFVYYGLAESAVYIGSVPADIDLTPATPIRIPSTALSV